MDDTQSLANQLAWSITTQDFYYRFNRTDL